MKKKILIISEFIAPVQSIASIRWTKYAKYLVKQCDCDITVLTNKKCFDNSRADIRPYKFDVTLEKDSAWFKTEYIPVTVLQRLLNLLFTVGYRLLHRMQAVSVTNSPSSNSEQNNANKFKRFRLKDMMAFLNAYSVPDKAYELVDYLCGKALVSAGVRCSVNFDEYDCIISTYSPRWTHDLAFAIKRKNERIFWIADFRDSLFYSKRTDTPARHELTKRYVNCADYILAVSKGCADNLFIGDKKPFMIAYNGFDPDDVTEVDQNPCGFFQLVYTGTLHSEGDAKRDLAPLYQAVEELILEGTIDRNRILCIYAGASSHLFQDYITQFPVVPFLDKGLLARESALKLQQNASALIVANWNTPITKGGLSGKVFEYLGKKVPLIGLVSGSVPHSALRNLIEECEAGFCYEEADHHTYDEMKQYVADLYCQWAEAGVTRRSDRSIALSSKYSYPVLAKRLYENLDGIRNSSRKIEVH